MKLVLFVGLLGGAVWGLGLPAFEAAFAVLLAGALASYLLGFVIGPGVTGAWLGLALALGLAALLAGRARERHPWKSELPTLAVFAVAFLLLHRLCISWSNFIDMGERLRDYSLLASVMRNPQAIEEPWLAGYTMNYYVYWYRFGHFLGRLLGLEVWETYHLLAAFSLSFYLAVTYRLLSRFLGFRVWGAAIGAVLLALGSNAAGVRSYLQKDDSWWGPSRVVAGAINEFPVWSFLLGDLHPHYVNLSLVPFVLLCFLSVPAAGRLLAASIGIPVVFLWIYNANPWEVPMWGGIVAVLLLAWLTTDGAIVERWQTFLREQRRPEPRILFASALIGALFVVALAIGASHLQPEGGSISRVVNPIPRTKVSELMLHFGVQLVPIALALILSTRDVRRACATAILLGLTLTLQDGVSFLVALLVLAALRVLDGGKARSVWIDALGIAGIGMIVIPEICFLDDPYGGENERMNTIFKVYSAAWFLLGLYALNCARDLWDAIPFDAVRNVWVLTPIRVVAFILLLGFFSRTVTLRKNGAPDLSPSHEGLAEVDRRFPGAAATIRKLRDLPVHTVLEGQGNAYAMTTFVSTLAGKTAFLGWANHVNLLNKAYQEVGRREQLTEEFYARATCDRRKDILRTEKIDLAVVGPLERTKYPTVPQQDFSCLREAHREGQFVLYQVG